MCGLYDEYDSKTGEKKGFFSSVSKGFSAGRTKAVSFGRKAAPVIGKGVGFVGGVVLEGYKAGIRENKIRQLKELQRLQGHYNSGRRRIHYHFHSARKRSTHHFNSYARRGGYY